ncbi:hypothetical protein LJK87_35775 [Paenibacillus sp. P25]|nr:hypothetical protein LJK87_35775 [Paenibacillus sp. P25]
MGAYNVGFALVHGNQTVQTPYKRTQGADAGNVLLHVLGQNVQTDVMPGNDDRAVQLDGGCRLGIDGRCGLGGALRSGYGSCAQLIGLEVRGVDPHLLADPVGGHSPFLIRS